MRQSAIVTGIWAAVLLGTAPSAAQNSGAAPPDMAASLEEAADRADVAGFAVTAVRDGSPAWTHAYGVRSTVTNPPVTPETVFEAAALGKPVVAYIVLKLAGEGVIDLDRPLAEYAEYDDLSHDERYREITAREVLMHATGLPTWRPPGGRLEFEFDPGLAFSYSGEAFLLLQFVVERVTLKPLDVLAEEYVFEPLSMTSSAFVWRQAFEEHVAAGHTEIGEAQDKFVPEVPNAAYSLHTTAPDYARFLVAAGTGEGLPDASAREMTMAQMDAGDGIYWGLGWGLEPTPGGMAVWQWGDTAGYKAFAWLGPDAKRGFVYLSNSNNGMLILEELFDRVVGGESTAVDWLQYEQVDDPSFLLGSRLIDAYKAAGMDSMRTAYEDARDELPPEAYDEISLNTLGYKFLRIGLTEEAIAVFEMNTEAYPRAYNTFDSLGEAHLAAGNLEAALRNYRRSVELNPDHASGRAMVRHIEQRLAADDENR